MLPEDGGRPKKYVTATKNSTFVVPCIIVQFIKKNPTRCNNVSKFYYSIFIWSSKCFGRHTAHHQEPKTALAVSGFSYVEGCWTCSWWTLSGTVCARQRPPATRKWSIVLKYTIKLELIMKWNNCFVAYYVGAAPWVALLGFTAYGLSSVTGLLLWVKSLTVGVFYIAWLGVALKLYGSA